MNRGIENPLFFIVFLGAFLVGIAVMYTYLKLEFGIGGGINPL